MIMLLSLCTSHHDLINCSRATYVLLLVSTLLPPFLCIHVTVPYFYNPYTQRKIFFIILDMFPASEMNEPPDPTKSSSDAHFFLRALSLYINICKSRR